MQEASIGAVKTFWNKRPCNIRHSEKPIGSKAYFEEVAARRYFVESHIPAFADFARWRDKKVLEVGCGIGTDAVQFAKEGAHMTMIDLSEQSLELAQQHFTAFGLKGTFFLENSEECARLLHDAQPFDLIYSFGVLHHTPHPEKALKELRALCKPSTELRIMLYAKWSWKMLWIIARFGKGAFWRWKELAAQYSEAQEGSPTTFVYSTAEIKTLLKKTGFELVSCKKDFIFPYKIDAYRRYEYKKEWYFRYLPRPLFSLLQKMLGWHMLVIARPI